MRRNRLFRSEFILEAMMPCPEMLYRVVPDGLVQRARDTPYFVVFGDAGVDHRDPPSRYPLSLRGITG